MEVGNYGDDLGEVTLSGYFLWRWRGFCCFLQEFSLCRGRFRVEERRKMREFHGDFLYGVMEKTVMGESERGSFCG